MTAGTIGLDEGFAPHLRDVMEIIFKVWSDVKPSAVKNCWRKSTLIFGENAVQGGGGQSITGGRRWQNSCTG